MPVTSGFSGFPHFTQRLLLTTSTYSFYFIFFYAKREIIFRKRTHGVWKRWVQICFYFLLNYKKKVVILFWYFSSLKSTRKEKLLYDSLRRQQATALRTKPKHNQQTKQKCAFHPVSARAKFTPAPPIIQRACRQCVHESARLSRALCSHAWYG